MENEIIEPIEVEVELPDLNDIDAVSQALEEKKITFSKVPKEKRSEIRNAVIKKLTEEAELDGNEKKLFALKQGWSPQILDGGKNKDGTPRAFKDYEEFTDTIRGNAPVMNERLQTLTKEMEEMKRENRKLLEISKMTFERSMQSEEKTIDDQIKQAREYGDFDAYDALMAKKQETQRQILKLKEPEAPPAQTDIAPEVVEWNVHNDWFRKDPAMTEFAIAQEQILQKTRPELNLSQRLNVITQSAKVSFPEKFNTFTETAKPAVLPAKNAGSFTANKKTELTFASLKDSEKLQVRQMIRTGVFKSEADYIKFCNNNLK